MPNVIILALAQMLAGSGLTVLIILGGILGAELAPRPALVTAPITVSIIAMALASVPAALIMRRIGRRAGFILGAALGVAGGLIGAQAVASVSFDLFCLSSIFIGAGVAFSQQYRFAAAESVAREQVSRAISYVLIGSIGAAIIGPQLALAGRWWIAGAEYAGSFLVISALYVLAAAVLFQLKLQAPVTRADASGQHASALLAQPMFRVAVLVSACAFMVMSFVMTATPISMHVIDHHSVEATTLVIQSHVLAMFLPSLVSGHVIARFGERAVVLGGTALLALCAVISVGGHQVMHYWWGMVLLGVGWNLLFVAATTLLTTNLSDANRHRGQAVNEFAVYGSQALASLLAGLAVQKFGWLTLNLMTLPLLLVMLVAGSKIAPKRAPCQDARMNADA